MNCYNCKERFKNKDIIFSGFKGRLMCRSCKCKYKISNFANFMIGTSTALMGVILFFVFGLPLILSFVLVGVLSTVLYVISISKIINRNQKINSNQ